MAHEVSTKLLVTILNFMGLLFLSSSARTTRKRRHPTPFYLLFMRRVLRVVHMSGAAKFFDRVEGDAEETRVLALDGSSALLLNHLQSPSTVTLGVAVGKKSVGTSSCNPRYHSVDP